MKCLLNRHFCLIIVVNFGRAIVMQMLNVQFPLDSLQKFWDFGNVYKITTFNTVQFLFLPLLLWINNQLAYLMMIRPMINQTNAIEMFAFVSSVVPSILPFTAWAFSKGNKFKESSFAQDVLVIPIHYYSEDLLSYRVCSIVFCTTNLTDEKRRQNYILRNSEF